MGLLFVAQPVAAQTRAALLRDGVCGTGAIAATFPPCSTTMKQIIRWYLIGPDDRTLVFVDNKDDFAGVTGLLNGNRITIGGQTTMNPLQMKPMESDAANWIHFGPSIDL